MAYIIYVNLFHAVSCFILSLISLFYSINVLFRKNVLKKSVNISPTITIYFCFIFIWALLTFAYSGYLLIFWRPSNGTYDAIALYFLGGGPSILLTSNSVAESFLCFERCLSLYFPAKYTKPKQLIYAFFASIGLIVIWIATGYFNSYLEFYPTNSKTDCQHFACLLPKTNRYLLYIKISLSCINIILAIILTFLIRNSMDTNSKKVKHINKIVVILIISTTFIELFPFVVGQIFSMISGQQLYDFIGSYGVTVVSLNITLYATVYFKAFKKSIDTRFQSKVSLFN